MKTAETVSIEKCNTLLGMFQEYVGNDSEAASNDYVRMSLKAVGIDKDNAHEYGFDDYFEVEDYENYRV